MSDLLPCPFCGGAVSRCDESPLYGGSIMHDETECLFKNNLLFHGNIAERWNSRPLEDALQARIEELEKTAIVWHRYPEEKPDKQDWYLTSRKGAIRMHFWVGGRIGFDTNPTDIPYVCPLQPHYWAYLPAPPKEEEK